MNDIEELELKISKFLRFGVLLAGFVILVGWLFNFQWSENPFAEFAQYRHVQLADALMVYSQNGDWGSLISFIGLFILISLPIIRVFLTTLLLLKQKEFLLGFIALAVLVGLLISFSLGIEI